MARSERTYPWTGLFFGNLAGDGVRFVLTRYFYRKSQVTDISSFVIWVPLGDGKRVFLEKKFLSCDRI